MRRTLALFALALPVLASDGDLREEIRELREKVETLETQQSALLGSDIEQYLAAAPASASAQGGEHDRITIHASITGVNQNTIGLDPSNRSVVSGDYDLEFDFQVTDNVSMFLHMTGNGFDPFGGDGSFPGQFPPGGTPGAPASQATFSGLFDGIGVNGTVPTSPGAATMYEAGIQFGFRLGELMFQHQLGELDPRTRFLQNDIADDAETQFLNDLFCNPPSVEWLTDASGRSSYGSYGWLSLGANKEWTISYGWFNTPGRWFDNGQFYFQVAWKGEVSGRTMNVRVLAWLQDFFQDATGDGSSGGGVSWDWWLTEKIGLWVRIAVNGGDANPVQGDYSFGAAWNGPFGNRPDDQVGLAIGIIEANDNVIAAPETTEITVELYYKLMLEGGKLQVTPSLMFVTDPGGGLPPWADDVLFILGVRFHVPF